MNKYKLMGLLFVVLGALVVSISAYFTVSYAGDMLDAIVDFVNTNDLVKLQQCGVDIPSEFHKLKNELTTVILPFLYFGIPVLLVALSILMFLGGFYYCLGKQEDEVAKTHEIERQMLRKMVKKIEVEKTNVEPPEFPEEIEEEQPVKTKKKK
ncbi:hypothetical protein KKB44_00070 [Candidatus Micrarchaeota archaeon]|nr:hypothetical protein [Candidatus Micrarchaeota archaeon]